MLSAVTPAMIEWVPHELLPIMPPSVQRLCVAGSGPKVSPYSSAASRSRSSTSPGCTRAKRRSGSSSTSSCMYFEKSSITASFTVWPASPVPHPRAPIGAPHRRQISTVVTTSEADRGITTPIGTCRWTEASLAYRARLPGEKRTSPRTAPASSCASARASSSALVAGSAVVAISAARKLLLGASQHAGGRGGVLHLARHHAGHRQRDPLAVGLSLRQAPGNALRVLGVDRRRHRHVVRIDDRLDQRGSIGL